MYGSRILMILLFWATIAAPLLAEVTVTIPDTTAYPEDTLFVPIKLSDVTGLEVYSYEFRMKFDPKVVQFIRVDSTKTLTETWGKTWLNTESVGEIRVGNYNVTPLQNAGVLIYLGFKMLGKIDDSSQFVAQDFTFNAGQPTVELKNGSVKILHPPISVRFRSNVAVTIKILLDSHEKKLPFDTSWAYGSSHTIGTISPQYFSSDTRYSFQSWSDGKTMSHTVSPISDTTFTLFMDEEFLLTLQSRYGTPTGGGWYLRGKNATFSVDSVAQQTDSTRYVFAQWSGVGASSYSGTQRTVTIIMNSPVIESAQWTQQYYLAIRSNIGTPIGQGWHNQGDAVTISIDSLVTPIAGTRYIFSSWTGIGSGSYTGAQRKVSVTMLAPIVQKANWQTEHYLKIKSSPEQIVQFKQSGWYAKNSLVSTDKALESVSSPGIIYRFKQWKLDQKELPGNPIQVTMDTSHIAEAVYQIDSVLVNITTSIGTGSFITVDGNRHPVPYWDWWQFQSRHHIDIDSIQLAANQKTRYVFKSWSDRGARNHTVVADTGFQLIAALASQHLLRIDTHPPGLIQFAENGWYDQGSSVNIPAVPLQFDIGQEKLNFKGWYLDRHWIGGELRQILMDRPHSAIAAYKELLSVKGKILNRRGQIVPNIKVILSGAADDTVIVADGEYAFEMLSVGVYQIAPQSAGFCFEPPARSYLPLSESLFEQNFIAIDTLKPQVQLIYPNGGERLVAASTDTIKWLAADNFGIDSIRIDLSSDHGQSWLNIIKFDSSKFSSYAWTIPNLSSDRCLLRITVKDFDTNEAEDLSDGMFTITPKSAVNDDGSLVIPTTFAVHQNYPNPFNNATQIRFQLPVAAQVQIKIFNTKGQMVATIVDRNFDAGYHQIDWNGRDQFGHELSSGIYFYQIQAGEQVVMRRMVLLR